MIEPSIERQAKLAKDGEALSEFVIAEQAGWRAVGRVADRGVGIPGGDVTDAAEAVAAGPGHYDAGWHVTGTVGHIGAAAATARLLGLSPDRTLAALGTGATQSAGMKVVYGSMGKSLHAGKAAMDGLLSGFLARDGFTSATDPIEGHRGFLHRAHCSSPRHIFLHRLLPTQPVERPH